jgi:hypothetical protein
MSDRDKLLGAKPNAGLSRPEPRFKLSWLVGILGFAVVALAVTIAFLLGRQTAPTTEPKGTVQPSAATQATSPTPQAAIEKVEKPSVPPIVLSRITDNDMRKIEPGAGCSFAVGDKYYLLSNFEQALIKVGGAATVHNLAEGAGQRLFEGASRVSVGKYLVDIKPRGKETQLYEGSTMPATLVISEGEARTELKGTWGCGA